MTVAPATTPPRSRRAAVLLRAARVPVLLIAAAAVVLTVTRVELAPTVSPDFFFATDDPALASTRTIEETFPSGAQIYIAARVDDPLSSASLERIAALTAALEALPEVRGVISLTRGPGRPELVPDSPLWGRLLLSADDPQATNLVVDLAPTGDADARRAAVAAVESVLDRLRVPSFALEVSGAPFVVEHVRRSLERDLRTFSLAAVIAFGLLTALVYRSLAVVVGTLVACAAAAAMTLAASHLLGTAIGVLTANIITVVFVLTLSHIVFLTANFDRVAAAAADRPVAERVDRAVARTLGASFWAMATTLLGFLSLRLASAQPLRELAAAGTAATLSALVAAYGLYPLFLSRRRPSRRATRPPRGRSPRALPAVALIAVAALLATGLLRLDTDPSLLAFFAPGSAIHRGIERIDRGGGSSPLVLVVRDTGAPDGRLLGDASNAKLQALQSVLEADAATGVVLSLPVLIEEARRVPLARFLGRAQLIDVLAGPQFGGLADGFIDPERERALYLLRMREAGHIGSRAATIERLEAAVGEAGLTVDAVGGIYHLQAALAGLVAGSLVRGLGGLLVLFVAVAAVVAGSARTAAAMVGALVLVPAALLGTMGWLGWPVDFISSPAANVALALGIDGMIHLVAAVRRRRRQGNDRLAAWTGAVAHLTRPILGALAILAGGFGIFALSSFPPTARFGIAVALGTLTAAAAALLVLPWLATAGRRR